MRVSAQKQNRLQQQTSHNTTMSRAHPLAVNPLIQLKDTIGNQALQRLLLANGQQDEQRKNKTEEPSQKALMLLDRFTKNKQGFRRFSGSEFQREANDKDASVEIIQSKKGEINWTYQFVTTRNTDFVYVRESQDGTEIVNYYQGILSEKTSPDAVSQSTSSTYDKSTTNDDKPEFGKSPAKIPSDSGDKDASDDTRPPDHEKKHKDKSAKKKDCRIGETVIPGGIYVGVFDQTWLPGSTFRGIPCHQGDLSQQLEKALVNFAGRIKNSGCIPKELKISVTLFNDTGGPAPGFKYAAENTGSNMKKFLEARLAKSIKITATHKVVDPGKSPSGKSVAQITVTPVY